MTETCTQPNKKAKVIIKQLDAGVNHLLQDEEIFYSVITKQIDELAREPSAACVDEILNYSVTFRQS